MVEISGWPVLLCCLNYAKPVCLDILIIIISIIEIILNALDIFIIPWNVTSKTMIILLAISIIIFLVSVICALTILYFRNKKKLFENKYNIISYFPIILIILIVLSIILSIIVCAVAVKDMSDSDNNNDGLKETKENVSSGKKIFTIISLIAVCILGLLLIALWAEVYLCLEYKVTNSYYNQLSIIEMENLKQKNRSEKSSIVGHDKNGNPVFGMKVGGSIKVTTFEDTNNSNVKIPKKSAEQYEKKNSTQNEIYNKYRSHSKSYSKTNVKNYDLTCEDIIDNVLKKSDIDLEGGVIVDVVNHNNSINPGY